MRRTACLCLVLALASCSSEDRQVANGVIAGRAWEVRTDEVDGDDCLVWESADEAITGGACEFSPSPEVMEVASARTADEPVLLIVYGTARDDVVLVVLHLADGDLVVKPRSVDGLDPRAFALAAEMPEDDELVLEGFNEDGESLETQTIVT